MIHWDILLRNTAPNPSDEAKDETRQDVEQERDGIRKRARAAVGALKNAVAPPRENPQPGLGSAIAKGGLTAFEQGKGAVSGFLADTAYLPQESVRAADEALKAAQLTPELVDELERTLTLDPRARKQLGTEQREQVRRAVISRHQGDVSELTPKTPEQSARLVEIQNRVAEINQSLGVDPDRSGAGADLQNLRMRIGGAPATLVRERDRLIAEAERLQNPAGFAAEKAETAYQGGKVVGDAWRKLGEPAQGLPGAMQMYNPTRLLQRARSETEQPSSEEPNRGTDQDQGQYDRLLNELQNDPFFTRTDRPLLLDLLDRDDQEEQHKAELAETRTLGGWVKATPGLVGSGAVGAIAEGIKGAGLDVHRLRLEAGEGLLGYGDQVPSVDETMMRQSGNRLAKVAEQLGTVPEAYQDHFISKALQGFGSIATYAGTGVATRGAAKRYEQYSGKPLSKAAENVVTYGPSTGLAQASGVSQAFDELQQFRAMYPELAESMGITEESAVRFATGLEPRLYGAVQVASVVSILRPLTGTIPQQVVQRMVETGINEFVVENLGQFGLANLRQKGYDENHPLWNEVPEAGAAAALGAMMLAAMLAPFSRQTPAAAQNYQRINSAFNTYGVNLATIVGNPMDASGQPINLSNFNTAINWVGQTFGAGPNIQGAAAQPGFGAQSGLTFGDQGSQSLQTNTGTDTFYRPQPSQSPSLPANPGPLAQPPELAGQLEAEDAQARYAKEARTRYDAERKRVMDQLAALSSDIETAGSTPEKVAQRQELRSQLADLKALNGISRSALGSRHVTGRLMPVTPAELESESLDQNNLRVDAEGAAALKHFHEALGHRVVYFRDTAEDGTPLPGGATFQGNDGSVYLNIHSAIDLMSETGHEVGHQIKQASPKAYKTLLEALFETKHNGKTVIENSDEALLAHIENYTGTKYASVEEAIQNEKRSRDFFVEEMAMDAVGYASRSPGFWKDVIETMGRKDMGAVQKLLEVIEQMIARLGAKSYTDLDPYINNLKELRKAAVQYMASVPEGTYRPERTPQIVDNQASDASGSVPVFSQGEANALDGSGRPRTNEYAAGDRGANALRADQATAANRGGERSEEPRWSRSGIASGVRRGGDSSAGQREESSQPGSVGLVGVHYSNSPRTELKGEFYGTGMKGQERNRVMNAEDPRLKIRVYAYVPEGKGVQKESGVGGYAHAVEFENLYDINEDSMLLRYRSGSNFNAMESSVLDHGYNGIYSPAAFRTQGVAYVMGDAARSIQTQPIEIGANVPGVTGRTDATSPFYDLKQTIGQVAALRDQKGIYAGQAEGSKWRQAIAKLDSGLATKLDKTGVFDRDAPMYLDTLAREYVKAALADQGVKFSMRKRIVGLIDQERTLSEQVDAAYEAGNLTLAEDLDAQLAEVRNEFDSVAAEYEAESGDTGMQAGDPDFEASLDGILAARWLDYQSPPEMFGGDREAVLANIRDALETWGARDVTDEQALAAAKDAYNAAQSRQERRARTRALEQRGAIDVDGVQRPTTNSEGRLIHPTEEGLRKFWKWFTDSIVVDDQGRPLVVYHGRHGFPDSLPGGITEFQPGEGRVGIGAAERSGGNLHGQGIWFTLNPEQASEYAGTEDAAQPVVMPEASVYPVYLRIINPKRVGWRDARDITAGELRQEKHDGAYIIDNGNWVALDGTQAKSAVGNQGTFDPSQADIRFSRSQAPTIDVDGVQRPTTNSEGLPIHPTEDGIRNFWRGFGDSKAVELVSGSSSRDAKFAPMRMYHTTRSAGFVAFESGRPTINSTTFGDVETTRNAIFFTPSVEDSNAYATTEGRTDTGAATMPVYLKTENPLDLTTGLLFEDQQRMEDAGLSSNWFINQLGSWEMFDDERGVDTVNVLRALGYDSVIFNDENPNTGESFESWAVFDPTQIKSAVGNQGTFDPSQADFLRSQRGRPEQGQPAPGAVTADSLYAESQSRTQPQESGNYAKQEFLAQGAGLEQTGDGRGRYSGGGLEALEGAPNVQGATGPDPRLVAVAERYAAANGIPLTRPEKYVEVNVDRARKIAQAYDSMENNPQDPVVLEAYQNLIAQTRAQYDALVAAKYEFTFFDSATDPYDGNPWNAMRDLRKNQRMAVYGTYDGYGETAITEEDVRNNPMLGDTGLRWPDQNGVERPVTANDLFRAVHDAFGHGLEGAGFRARGEENAWQAHVRLFTGSAVGAITSETRGQNSWLNFGPYGEANRTAKLEDTVFAAQKTGLMPEWTWTEGRAGDKVLFSRSGQAPKPGKGAVAGAKTDIQAGTVLPASYKPGKTYGSVIYPANGGNLTRLHERMLGITRSSEFARMLESIGLQQISPANQKTVRGMWLGEPEWTQVLRLKQLDGTPATFEQTRAVANLLGWATQQDAALTSMVVDTPVSGEYNIPSLYFGKGSGVPLTAAEIDTALSAFAKVSAGASVTLDGKAIKFLFFPKKRSKKSEEDQFVDFGNALAKIAQSVGLDPNSELEYTISSMDEFNKETNQNEGRGYRGRNEKTWGAAAQGLGPRASPDGIGRRAVDTVLVPYIAAVRAEGFTFDFDVWQRRNRATDRELAELQQKVADYEGQNKHGLKPRLRETIDISGLPAVPIEGPVAQKTTSPKPDRVVIDKGQSKEKKKTWGNADAQLQVLDDLKSRFPDATLSAENWLQMEAHAFGGNDVPVAPRNIINLMANNGAGMLAQLRQLTPGQIQDANSGFDNAAKFFELYTSGKVPVETTGKLFLWSFLSRGVSPYVQESMFLDAVRGIEPFVQQAARGEFGPAELAQFESWADGIAAANGQGAPGNATKHNLNAFGSSFLVGMSQRLPDANLNFTGKTKLQRLHDLLSDPTQTGRNIRREFVRLSEGVGIDNKVMSFTLLVTGRPDVLVLDRIQMRNLFDDGSFEGYNLYDGTRLTKITTGSKGNKTVHETLRQEENEADAVFDERVDVAMERIARELGTPVSQLNADRAIEPGTGLANMTTGARGLILYEFIEDGMSQVLPSVYKAVGRPKDATPGRYHWESWVVVSGQEASHGTLDSLLYELEGKENPFADVSVKQGEYGQKDYGVRYARDAAGVPYYTYLDSKGKPYRLTHGQWRAFLGELDRLKGRVPGFRVSQNEDGTSRTEPWYNDPRIDRAQIDALLEENSGQADPRILESRQRWYRSDLAQAIPEMKKVAAKDGTITTPQAKQWLQARQKQGKFKADELQWSGVLDWLSLQKGRIPVDDIQSYVEQGGVQVEEVVLDDGHGLAAQLQPLFEEDGFGLEYNSTFGEFEFTDLTNGELVDFGELSPRLINAINDKEKSVKPSRYAGFKVPGGANYREVLLTLPIKETQTAEQAESYQTKHWPTPNVLAHLRVDDRNGPEGEKILFVNEVQSDWGQRGHQLRQAEIKRLIENDEVSSKEEAQKQVRADYGFVKGFSKKALMKQFDNLSLEKNKLDAEINTIFERWIRLPSDPDKREAALAAYQEQKPLLEERLKEVNQQLGRLSDAIRYQPETVPVGPFVMDTQSWVSLALKRALAMAAEGGYDRVAFVRGKQAANLYPGLETQVKHIYWNEKTGVLAAEPTNEYDSDIREYGVTAEKLPDYIGQETARKLIAAKEYVGYRSLKGNNLKIEAKGMRKFYDEILPQVANKILKPFGQKVGQVELDTGTQNAITITPEMRQEIQEQKLPLFSQRRDMRLVERLTEAATRAPSRNEQRYFDRAFEQHHRDFMAELAKHGEVPKTNIPMTSMPAVLQMLGERSQVVTTHTNIYDKVKVWKHGQDLQLITPSKLNRLMREPALVMSEDKDIVMLSDSWGEEGPLLIALKPNTKTDGVYHTSLKSVYSLPVDKARDKIREALKENRLKYVDLSRLDGVFRAPLATPEASSGATSPTLATDQGSLPPVRSIEGTVAGETSRRGPAAQTPRMVDHSLGVIKQIRRAREDRKIKEWEDLVGYLGDRYTGPESDRPSFSLFRRNQPAPLGAPPSGPTIEPHLENILRLRAVWNSATDVIRRAGMPDVADAINNFYDGWDAWRGRILGSDEMLDVLKELNKLSSKDRKQALDDYQAYQAANNNGRPAQAQALRNASPIVSSMIDVTEWMYDRTGNANKAVGVKVYDAKLGQWRPIGKIPKEKMFSRMLKPEVADVLQGEGPRSNPALWNQMVAALISTGHVANAQDAWEYVSDYYSEFTKNDYFAGIEKARARPLPEMFYDYSWNAMIGYADRWSQRISQIEQFGQKLGPKSPDALEKAIAKAGDRRTKDYLTAIRNTVFQIHPRQPLDGFLANTNMLATGLQLANPLTASRNLGTGLIYNWADYGTVPAAKAFWELATAGRNAYRKATNLGVLKDDLLMLTHDMVMQGGSQRLAKVTSYAMRAGLYTLTERFIRAHAVLSGKYFLADALQQWNTDPHSRASKRYYAWFQRHHLDIEKLKAESGIGDETAKWLRLSANIPQGSYRLDMTPLFTDTPMGRFLWKYQKYGTQRTREFVDNGLKPFIRGEKVEYKDSQGNTHVGHVRNFQTLLRMAMASFLFGTALAKVLEAIFGTPDPGPDLDELEKALEDGNHRLLIGLALSRWWHSSTALGALGFFQAPVQMTLDVADRQRMKSPIDPPALAPIKGVLEVLMQGYDQGTLTLRDIDNALMRNISLYRATKRGVLTGADAVISMAGLKEQTVENLIGVNRLHRESQLEILRRERQYVQRLARRFAAEEELVGKRRASGNTSKTPMSPVAQKVITELLLGNAEGAKAIVQAAMENAESNREADSIATSIKSSVRSYDPGRITTAPSEYERARFLLWVQDRVSPENYQRVLQHTENYRTAAVRAGLAGEEWKSWQIDIEAMRRDLREDLPRELLIQKQLGFQ